jgi:hypothetical protein
MLPHKHRIQRPAGIWIFARVRTGMTHIKA